MNRLCGGSQGDELRFFGTHPFSDRFDVEEHQGRFGWLVIVVEKPFVHLLVCKRIIADEVQLIPKALQLGSSSVVEQKSAEWFVFTMEHEEAALRIPWDDGFEERCGREEGPKSCGVVGPLREHLWVDDLGYPRIGTWEAKWVAIAPRCRAASCRVAHGAAALSEKEDLHRGVLRAFHVEPGVGSEESWEGEGFEEGRRQFGKIDDQFRGSLHDQGARGDASPEGVLSEAVSARLDCGAQFGMFRKKERWFTSAFEPEVVPDDKGVWLRGFDLQRHQAEACFTCRGLRLFNCHNFQGLFPRGEPIPNGQHLELVVGAPEQFVLQHVDGLYHRLVV